GDGAAALVAAEEAVALEPLRESAHLRVMRAHAAAGNRADALRAYERVRKTLADELGVNPSAQTESAYLALLQDEDPAPAPTAPVRAGLPLPLSSFVGREAEVGEVEGLAGAHRLVTILGTGGLGKTRLALEIARRRAATTAVFVELAEVRSPDDVAATALAAVGGAEEPGRPPLATLTALLAEAHAEVLLVLDNCEHVVGAAAALVLAVLQSCPGVTVLATSREALRVPGEVAWELAPLPAEDAARLFVERAVASSPGFGVAEGEAADLAAICARLDGLPLAIELAAARAGILSVGQIAERLDDRFGLLTGGARTAPERQRTLRGALDWSYDALAAPERAVLQRLSVFAGSFSLDAAERVAGDADLIDLLATLVGHSLVRTERSSGGVRYRLLETVRAYAAEKLDASGTGADGGDGGDGAAVRLRLLRWAADAAEAAEQHLDGPDQARWLDRLAADHANLRAALAVDTRHPDALRLAAALGRFWEMRGHFQEGRQWLRTILGDSDGSPGLSFQLARAHNAAAILAQRQGDYAAARSRLEASLALRRDAGDALGAAIALHGLGNLAALQHDLAAARRLYEESLARGRELGEDGLVAASLDNLGWVAHTGADFAAAHGYYEEALDTRRRLGDRHGTALVLGQLGDLAYQRGDYEAAARRHGESLELRTALGDRAGRADSLATLGHLALHDGDLATARARLEESLALREELGDRSGLPSALTNLADLALVAGAADEARSRLASAAAVAKAGRDGLSLAHVLIHAGRVERAAGNAGRAAGLYAEARRAGGTFAADAVGAEWLEGVGATVAIRGDGAAGARLLAAAHRLREAVGAAVPPHEQALSERDLAAVRGGLGDKAFKAAWRAGLALSAETAFAEAAAAIG
ncbi:MAG: ATP-binding protein, partial [Acidimicrobiales bacterium]